MSIEFFVGLRDLCNAEIERMTPEEAKPTEQPTKEQFQSLKYVTKDGAKGTYEQATDDGSEAFRTVNEYVKSQGGFCSLYGFKVWRHNEKDIIDRKK